VLNKSTLHNTNTNYLFNPKLQGNQITKISSIYRDYMLPKPTQLILKKYREMQPKDHIILGYRKGVMNKEPPPHHILHTLEQPITNDTHNKGTYIRDTKQLKNLSLLLLKRNHGAKRVVSEVKSSINFKIKCGHYENDWMTQYKHDYLYNKLN